MAVFQHKTEREAQQAVKVCVAAWPVVVKGRGRPQKLYLPKVVWQVQMYPLFCQPRQFFLRQALERHKVTNEVKTDYADEAGP